jgi:secondary thiamine-phosphate synthase enzyme
VGGLRRRAGGSESGGVKPIRQEQQIIEVRTSGKGLVEITAAVADFVGRAEIATGVLTLFIRHTSASLLIQENADPSVLRDLKDFFERIAPEDFAYAHDTEGPDDMPAHIRAALTQVSLSIPVAGGRMVLGTWQGIYVFEHRSASHRRQVVAHLIGD